MGPINGQTDIVLGFGKYKGMTLSQIWDSGLFGQSYVMWLAERANTPSVRASARAFLGRTETKEK